MISLFEELVLAGIIKKVEKYSMNEYSGEYSYLGTTLRQANVEPQPTLSDVRRLVTEYAILPLGELYIHSFEPSILSRWNVLGNCLIQKNIVRCSVVFSGSLIADE